MEFHAVKLFQRVLGQTEPTCLLYTPDTYIMFIGISTYNTCNYIQYLFLQHFEAKKKLQAFHFQPNIIRAMHSPLQRQTTLQNGKPNRDISKWGENAHLVNLTFIKSLLYMG